LTQDSDSWLLTQYKFDIICQKSFIALFVFQICVILLCVGFKLFYYIGWLKKNKKTSLILNFNHCLEGIEMKFGLIKEKDVFSKCWKYYSSNFYSFL